MILVGSYGTESTTVLGFLTVVVAPPLTFVASIGFLRRMRWARHYLVGLFTIILIVNVVDFLSANPEPTREVSPSGVPTTTLPTDRAIFVPMIVLSAAMLGLLLSRRVRLEFPADETPRVVVQTAQAPRSEPHASPSRDWHVGHVGRDGMYYEERHTGGWQRIEIDGEMLIGPAHHAVYLASPERWRSYPEWARDRRDEIVARIKSEFREPDYEYSHAGAAPIAPTRASAPSHPGNRWAVILAVTILLGLAAGTGWLAYHGVGSGETMLPAKMSSHRRPVVRASEPVLFWFSIGLYASIAIGCVGLVGWGVAQTRRDR